MHVRVLLCAHLLVPLYGGFLKMDRGDVYKNGGNRMYNLRIVIIMASMSVLALHGAQRDSIDENDPRLWQELGELSRNRSTSGEYDDAYLDPLSVLVGPERTISRDAQEINARDPRTAVNRGSSSQFGLGDLEDPEPTRCKNMRMHCRSLRQY